MSDFDPCAFGITVRRQTVDGEVVFVGTATEFPDLRVYEASYNEAYEAVADAVQTLRDVSVEQGLPFPEPEDAGLDVSGRVTLRLPKALHSKLARLADSNGTSLNTYLATLLAERSTAGDFQATMQQLTAEIASRVQDIFTSTQSSLSIGRIAVGTAAALVGNQPAPVHGRAWIANDFVTTAGVPRAEIVHYGRYFSSKGSEQEVEREAHDVPAYSIVARENARRREGR